MVPGSKKESARTNEYYAPSGASYMMQSLSLLEGKKMSLVARSKNILSVNRLYASIVHVVEQDESWSRKWCNKSPSSKV
jgi:hypothetical protein